MKDHEEISELSNTNYAKIRVFEQLIEYCKKEIIILENYDAEHEFYSASSDHPDYP